MIGNTSKLSIEITVDDKGAVTALRRVGTESEKAGRKGKNGFKGMGREVDKFSAKTRGASMGIKGIIATAGGLIAVRRAFHAISSELTGGLKAVEDYRLSVATMTGFMITNSRKLQQGDMAGAYRDANTYAGKLIPKLELIAAQTLGTGKDLKAITETMMMHGVVLDINNKKEVNGLKNITNVLKMVTAGQNQDIQMRQEINGLLTGQIRMQDRLPTLLKAIDPNLKEHLKLWQQQGTTIEHVGALLKGFDPATRLVEQTWTSIGTTMETINTKVLRGGMQPVFADLMAKAQQINSLFMDKDGHLTQFSYDIQDNIHDAWDYSKNLGKELKALAFDPETAKIIKTLGVIAGLSMGGKIVLGMASMAPTPVGVAAGIVGAGYYLSKHGNSQRPNIDPDVHSTLGGNSPGVETWINPVLKDSLRMSAKLYANTGKILSNEKMIALEAAKNKTNGKPDMTKKIPEFTPAHLKQRHLETEAEWQAKTDAALKKHNDLLAEGARLYKSTRTPLEQYKTSYAEYGRLLAEGAIDQDTYNRAVNAAGDTLDKATVKTKEATDKMSQYWIQAERNMVSFTGDTFYSLLKGQYDNIGGAFEDMLTRMVSQYAAAQMQMALMGNSNSGGLGNGLIGLAANFVGGLFSSGPSYNVPTQAEAAMPADWHAPMAYPGRAIGGATSPRGLYEVNEDQPEVISVGGRDYLMMGSKGGNVRPVNSPQAATRPPVVQVNIHNAPGTEATVQQSDDGMSMDVIISRVEDGISGNVRKGTGSLAATMEGTYGLNRAAGAY